MSGLVALSRRLHVEEDRCKRSCVSMREVCVGGVETKLLVGIVYIRKTAGELLQ
ncbi:unnamed protein product [Brassica oleracea]